MLIMGKNGTSGILNVEIFVFCGCLHIINKNMTKVKMKITKDVIAYPSDKSSVTVSINDIRDKIKTEKKITIMLFLFYEIKIYQMLQLKCLQSGLKYHLVLLMLEKIYISTMEHY